MNVAHTWNAYTDGFPQYNQQCSSDLTYLVLAPALIPIVCMYEVCGQLSGYGHTNRGTQEGANIQLPVGRAGRSWGSANVPSQRQVISSALIEHCASITFVKAYVSESYTTFTAVTDV